MDSGSSLRAPSGQWTLRTRSCSQSCIFVSRRFFHFERSRSSPLREASGCRHCASASNAQSAGDLPPSGNPMTSQTSRALQARPDHAAEPPGDGAADAQPRDAARHGAEPACGRLLRPARLRRPARHRGEPGVAAGPGLSGHARHLFEGAGRGLAQGHRARAWRRRAHLHPDLACRPHLAHVAAGGRRQAGGAERDPRQGQDLRQQPVRRHLRAARAGAVGNSRHHRRLQARCGERARGRLRRRRDPWRQRLSARPVRQGRHQQAHRCLRRIDREPRQADAGSLEGRRRGSRRRAHRHPHLAGDAGQRRLAIPIRSRCSITSSTAWRR